jgi:pimeloyl-ACP methyl ester carboxylesterase
LLQSFCKGRIFAERTGVGQPQVIGLHGWARTRSDLAVPLAGFNALAFDLPGFGASPEPPTVWGSKDYAAIISDVLSSLDGPQILLGHSFGGRIAVRLAAYWPELVSGLVLTGVPLFRQKRTASPPALRFRMARWANRHGFLSEMRMEKARKRYGSPDYRNADGIMRSILVKVVNESYEEDLTRIICPVELVWGANDYATPLEDAREACKLLRQARLEVIEDSGHMTPISAPEELRSSVCRLIQASAR